jgi:hypothetical protein
MGIGERSFKSNLGRKMMISGNWWKASRSRHIGMERNGRVRKIINEEHEECLKVSKNTQT